MFRFSPFKHFSRILKQQGGKNYFSCNAKPATRRLVIAGTGLASATTLFLYSKISSDFPRHEEGPETEQIAAQSRTFSILSPAEGMRISFPFVENFKAILSGDRRFQALGWLVTTNVGTFALIRGLLAGGHHLFVLRHFMDTHANFSAFRWHTMVTSSFSHMDFPHFAFNMIGLLTFGGSVCRLPDGQRTVLETYFGGAVTSSAVFLLWHLPALRLGIPTSSLGASGAIYALIAMDVLARGDFTRGFVYVALEAIYATAQPGSRTSHIGHFGGALFGVLYFLLYWRHQGPGNRGAQFDRSMAGAKKLWEEWTSTMGFETSKGPVAAVSEHITAIRRHPWTSVLEDFFHRLFSLFRGLLEYVVNTTHIESGVSFTIPL